MRPISILPSILACDFTRLGDEVRSLARGGGDFVHIDVMDGHFVPNISMGPGIVKAIRPVTDKAFDVHLMISPADPYIADFVHAGADMITVHAEAGPHLHRSLQAIRHAGRRAGVALNPATHESAIAHVLDGIDLVLVMTVNPGFGGQSFLPAMLDKISRVRAMAASRDIDIEVDGGITPETAGAVALAGANFLVAGSAVFKDGADKIARNILALRNAAASARGEIV